MLWHEPSQCDLLSVTLNKSEALFSPSTRTRGPALGPSRLGLLSEKLPRISLLSSS